MTLKLHRLTSQLDDLSAYAVETIQASRAEFPKAEADFQAACGHESLHALVRKAAAEGWDGAAPYGPEPLATRAAAPALDPTATLVAVDGSQIYPDRHAASLYYAINIGYFVRRYRSGETEADSTPQLAFRDEEVLSGGHALSTGVVNGRRAAEEMSALQKLAAREQAARPQEPVVALLDGTIALRLSGGEAFPRDEAGRLQTRYFAAIGALTGVKIPFAGYVARPGGTPVLALAALAAARAPRNRPDSPGTIAPPPYKGISDRAFFESRLGSGERSAVFEYVTFWNSEYRKATGPEPDQGVCFFYLNVSRGRPVVARVEIPGWVAAQPAMIDRIHAALLEQCAVTLNDPYPYALIRADEEAFVSMEEKSFLERQMNAALIRSGLPAARSEKLMHKGRARRKAR